MANLKLGDWVVDTPEVDPVDGTIGSAVILGTTYTTVIMPDGKEWIANNLVYPNLGSWYNGGLVDDGYGRLYSREELDAIIPLLSDGWRCPSDAEWNALITALGGTGAAGGPLKTVGTLYWDSPNTGASDLYGFGIRGAGSSPIPGVYHQRKQYAYIWSSDPGYHLAFFESGTPYAYVGVWGNVETASVSVRLLRDTAPTPPTYLSGTHDLLVLPNGRAETTNSLAQRVDVRLRTFIGEHWLNPELGVPWFRDFLTKAPDLAVCRQTLWDVIRGVRGVQSINRLELSIAKGTRILTITFAVNGTDSFTSTIPV